jgi:hypothetical protein
VIVGIRQLADRAAILVGYGARPDRRRGPARLPSTFGKRPKATYILPRLDPAKAIVAKLEPPVPPGTFAVADPPIRMEWTVNMRLGAMMFTCLIGFAAITTLPGCAPTTTTTTTQIQACPPGAPPGTPWVPGDYANGKWVPGHCLGYPAQ